MRPLEPATFVAFAVVGVALTVDGLPNALRAVVTVGVLVHLAAGSGGRDGRLSSPLARLHVPILDGPAVTAVVDSEIGRAQRLEHGVVVAGLPAGRAPAEVIRLAERVRRAIRAHDVIVHDERRSMLHVIAVVPPGPARDAVAAKLIAASDRATIRFYPDHGWSGEELVAPGAESPPTDDRRAA